MAEVGAVIMGHTTFELGVGSWGDDPTFHAPCFVVSHEHRDTIVKDGGTSYAFVTDGIERALVHARPGRRPAARTSWSWGAPTSPGSTSDRDCSTSFGSTWCHILLGDGTRLFQDLGPEPIELQLVETVDAPGVTHLRFRTGSSQL